MTIHCECRHSSALHRCDPLWLSGVCVCRSAVAARRTWPTLPSTPSTAAWLPPRARHTRAHVGRVTCGLRGCVALAGRLDQTMARRPGRRRHRHRSAAGRDPCLYLYGWALTLPAASARWLLRRTQPARPRRLRWPFTPGCVVARGHLGSAAHTARARWPRAGRRTVGDRRHRERRRSVGL